MRNSDPVLQSCPWCDEQPEYLNIMVDRVDTWAVLCRNTDCPMDCVMTHPHFSKRAAADAWNHRLSSESL